MPSLKLQTLSLLLVAIVIGTTASASLWADPPGKPVDGPSADSYRTAEWLDRVASASIDAADGLDLFPPERLDSASSTLPTEGIVFLAGYGREGESSPRDHDVREEIHEEILRTPGRYVNELRETIEIPRSTLRYHLRVLEGEGLVYSAEILGKLRYYPIGEDADELAAALASDATAAVLDGVARLEPVSVSELASEMDRSPSTVSYHLDRLDNAGLVERYRDGRRVLTRMIRSLESNSI